MPNDYSRIFRVYGRSGADLDLPSVTPVLIAAASATKRIRVLFISFTPSSSATTGTLTFLDSLTGKAIGALTVSPTTANQLALDFGQAGIKLSPGAHLLLGITGGAIGRLHVDAVQVPN